MREAITMNETTDKQIRYIEVKFRPEWTYISCIQTFVMNFFTVGHVDPMVVQRIAMIVSELLENAVKYARKSDATIRVSLEDRGRELEVAVSNEADEDQLKTLESLIEDINRDSPQEAYIRRLQEAVAGEGGPSRVGLARIRFEGEAEIRHAIEGAVVTMRATCINRNHEGAETP